MGDDGLERIGDICGYGLWRRKEPHGGFSYWTDDIACGRRIFDEGMDDWRILFALAERLNVDFGKR